MGANDSIDVVIEQIFPISLAGATLANMDRHIGVATPFNNVMHVATITNKIVLCSQLSYYFYVHILPKYNCQGAIANATNIYSDIALPNANTANTISDRPNILLKTYMPIMLPKICITVLVAAYRLYCSMVQSNLFRTNKYDNVTEPSGRIC